ncbi:MAG: hypothetical protein GF398_06845 [Chitinivibrionales bacterium]|nr:hypothetical protein [Chitinivibrionales bacterium]
MNSPFLFIVCTCLTTATQNIPAGYAPNLRLNDQTDLFVHRIASRYGLQPPAGVFAQPMDAAELLAFLRQVDSLDSMGRLTAQESFHRARLLRQTMASSRLYGWRHEEKDVSANLRMRLAGDADPTFAQRENSMRLNGVINPRLTGNAGNFSFFSGVDIWTEYDSDTLFSRSTYQPFDGIPYNLYSRKQKASTRSSDILRGGIAYDHELIDLQASVDYVKMGPAVYNHLTFSAKTPPVISVRGSINVWKFRYYHLFGRLKEQKDKQKYFYAHRYQVPLWKKRLTIGFNEVMVNGSTAEKAQEDSLRAEYYGEVRVGEWIYMIPFVPYAFAEHFNGDRDNAVMSFDASLYYPAGVRWYGEFFMDDFTNPWSLFSDDFGNKLAFTIGAQYFENVAGMDITLTLEYARLRPWVYTHFYGGSHRYTHFGMPLGSQLGPNADEFIFALEGSVGRLNTAGIVINTKRKGTAHGSDVRDVMQDSSYTFAGEEHTPANPDPLNIKTFGEGFTRTSSIGLLWKFNPFGYISFHAAAELEMVEDETHFVVRMNGSLTF